MSFDAKEQARKMSEVWLGLEVQERETVVRFAARLAAGQVAYGPLRLQDDPRNWAEERDAEALDFNAYSIFEEIQGELKPSGSQ